MRIEIGLAGYVERGLGSQRGGFEGKITVGQSVHIKELKSSQPLVERGLFRNYQSFVIVSQLCCWLQAFHSRNVLFATLLLCFSGCSQGTPNYSSSHHLFRGAVAPCQSSPMTRLGVSGEPSPCASTSRNTPGVASTQQPPVISSGVPFVSGGDRPLTSEPPPRWARRRRRSVARTIAAELAENRRLARELSKREEEKLDRLIAIGEEASAQQDTANELRRDAVIAVRRLATAVEEATGAFQLGLEKLLQRLISNTKS